MRAMILAAGLGTRLRPRTDSVPKALTPVAGRPLIEYPLRFLRAQGIRQVVINVHHLGEQIQATLGDGRALGIEIFYSREESLLDTGGGIKHAQALLGGGRFVVINGDTIMDLDLAAVSDFHARKGAAVSLVLRRDPEAGRFGVIETDDDGRVRRFLGIPSKGTQTPPSKPLAPCMFTGLQIMEPEVFAFMPPGGAFSTTRDTCPRMLAAARPLFGFIHDGPWIAVDDPAGLSRADEMIRSGRMKLTYLG